MKRWINSQAGRRLWKLVKDILTLILICSIYIWSQSRQNARICKSTLVSVLNSAENHFLDNSDIRAAIDNEQNSYISLRRSDAISLWNIEREVNSLTYVNKAQAWQDLSGKVHIDVELHKPIARIILPSGDRYLCAKGKILPLSDKYTARVLTIGGRGASEIIHPTEKNKNEVAQIIHFIQELAITPVWKSIVAHIDINEQLQMQLYPTVGNEVIELGSIQNYPQKMEKLEIYYRKIIPARGWDAYQKVILKYNNQIICEKKS